MRLLNPSKGECIDRLSILARKIEEAPARRIDPKHWQEEEDELLKYVYDQMGPGHPTVLALHLAAVNAMIWAEQELIAEDYDRPGKRAFDLNLRRAELVAQLSGEEQSREKI